MNKIMSNLVPLQSKAVQQMINYETFFRNIKIKPTEANPSTMTNSGMIYGSRGCGKKFCVFELVKVKPQAEQFSVDTILYKKLNKFPIEICDTITDYIKDSEDYYVELNTSKDKRHFVNTTLVVIQETEEILWKRIHDKYFPDIKIKFVSSKNGMKKLIKKKFACVEKYDMIFLTEFDYEYLNVSSKYLKDFRFNRVVFSGLTRITYAPESNFTWAFVRSELTRFGSISGLSRRSLPVSMHDKRIIWSKLTSNLDIHRSLLDASSVKIDLTPDVPTRLHVQQIQTPSDYSLERMVIKYKACEELSKHNWTCPDKYYLIVSYRIKNSWITNKSLKNCYVIDDYKGFDKDEFLKSGKRIIFATSAQISQRSDLNLDFITDIFFLYYGIYGPLLSTKLLSRCLCFSAIPSRSLSLTIFSPVKLQNASIEHFVSKIHHNLILSLSEM